MKTEQKPQTKNPYSFTDPITLANVLHAYQEGYAAGLRDKALELSKEIEKLNFKMLKQVEG